MTAEVTIQETVELNSNNASKEANVSLLKIDKDFGLVHFIDMDNRNREYTLPLFWGFDYSQIKKINITFK